MKFNKNITLILSLLISYFIAFFIFPFFSNERNLISLKKNLKNLFSSNFIQKRIDYQINNKNFISVSSFILPTFSQSNKYEFIPTITSIISPTIFIYQNTPEFFFTKTPTKIITPFLSPTKKIKPTNPPDVFPIDSSLARPGKDPEEVFKIASQKTCVPKEILKAIAYIESGGFFDVVPIKYFLLYNSYNWWNSEFLTEEKRICGGYGYDLNTGLVPDDSKFAGYKCKEGYNSGLNVMGVMSISSYQQSKYEKKVAQILGVNKVDRRVILDALIIAGLIIKDNVKPSSCTNWNGHEIVKAACVYYGSCGIADGTYYCATFCRNYKKFGGKGSCDASSFGDNCWK